MVLAIVGTLLLPGAASEHGLDTSCQFSLTRLDASTTNVLAVDTNAVYWVGTYAALPGTRIRIEASTWMGPASSRRRVAGAAER